MRNPVWDLGPPLPCATFLVGVDIPFLGQKLFVFLHLFRGLVFDERVLELGIEFYWNDYAIN